MLCSLVERHCLCRGTLSVTWQSTFQLPYFSLFWPIVCNGNVKSVLMALFNNAHSLLEHISGSTWISMVQWSNDNDCGKQQKNMS
jgi:hypothetical protein